MIKWKKPSGVIIETNESKASKEAAVKLGWELVVESPQPKKRGPKPKKVEVEI